MHNPIPYIWQCLFHHSRKPSIPSLEALTRYFVNKTISCKTLETWMSRVSQQTANNSTQLQLNEHIHQQARIRWNTSREFQLDFVHSRSVDCPDLCAAAMSRHCSPGTFQTSGGSSRLHPHLQRIKNFTEPVALDKCTLVS